MAQMDTAELFQKAGELATQREEIVSQQAAIRDLLRGFEEAGILDDDEKALLAEIFPRRKRKDLETEVEDENAVDPAEQE